MMPILNVYAADVAFVDAVATAQVLQLVQASISELQLRKMPAFVAALQPIHYYTSGTNMHRCELLFNDRIII